MIDDFHVSLKSKIGNLADVALIGSLVAFRVPYFIGCEPQDPAMADQSRLYHHNLK